MYQCFKARYFPRSHFLEAKRVPKLLLRVEKYYGCLAYIKIWALLESWEWAFNPGLGDKWIPNYPSNSIIHSAKEDLRDALVSELINQELHLWRSDFIMEVFEKEDVEAICRIPLSRRYVEDSIV